MRAYARNVPRTLCDRQLKKSTKQTDRAKALEVCLALERAEGMTARGTLTETRARELIGEVWSELAAIVCPSTRRLNLSVLLSPLFRQSDCAADCRLKAPTQETVSFPLVAKRGIPSGGIPDYLVNAIVAQLVDRLIRNCLTCFCVDFRNIAQPVFQGQL